MKMGLKTPEPNGNIDTEGGAETKGGGMVDQIFIYLWSRPTLLFTTEKSDLK